MDTRDYEALKLKLEWAIQLRSFEIEHLWKRFNSFWVINAAALAGYIAVHGRGDDILLLISCFGLVSSVSWTLVNIGSKWWQRSWEERLRLLCKEGRWLDADFFAETRFDDERIFGFPLRRFSVSGIAVGISPFSTLLWFGLATWHAFGHPIHISNWQITLDTRYMLAYIGTVVFCILIGCLSLKRK